jgi:hypothetical protein
MPFREGEVYRCPYPDCGCEVTVTKAPSPACCFGPDAMICCGMNMVKTTDTRRNPPRGTHPRRG